MFSHLHESLQYTTSLSIIVQHFTRIHDLVCIDFKCERHLFFYTSLASQTNHGQILMHTDVF